jgi:LemA protein
MMRLVVFLGVLLVVVLLILLTTYNFLTQLRQEVRLAWAKLDEALKRRYDLIPSLAIAVQSIGGAAAAKLAAVHAAKNQAAIAFNPQQLASAEAALTAAIHDLLQTADTDPAIGPDAQFADIRHKLATSEKQIDHACRKYNQSVELLNDSMRSFPNFFTAGLISYKPQPLFALPMQAS